jgi:hypothetical protein
MKQSTMIRASKRKTKGLWPIHWKKAEAKASRHRQRQIHRTECIVGILI